MKTQFIFLIPCFVLLFGLTAFWAANATDSPPACTSYTYSDWSSCDPNVGSQERINTASFPAGCVIDFSGNNPAPITRQRCSSIPPAPQSVSQPSQSQPPIVPPAPQAISQPSQPQASIVPPVPFCTSYTYSNWSPCDPSGVQERTQTASYPNGCVIDFTSTTLVPITRQRCTYVPPVPFCTSYTYSDWSSCDPNVGSQERINTASFPAGCVIDFSGNNPAPITRQKCTYVPPAPQSVSQPLQPQQPVVSPVTHSVQPSQFQQSTWFSSAQGASASTTPPTPQSSLSIQELFDQIKILQKKVSELQASQPGKQSSVSGNAPSDANSAVNACVVITNNLTYRSRDGFTNGDVSALQDFLQAKGYLTIEPSGFFGLLTLQAVKNFQTDNNINPTGFVGSVTRGKIQQLTCK